MGILYGKYDVMDGDIFYHVYWELIMISIIRFSHQDHGFLFLDEDFMRIVYIQYDDMNIYIYIKCHGDIWAYLGYHKLQIL